MKAPDRLMVEFDGLGFADIPAMPADDAVEYVRADLTDERAVAIMALMPELLEDDSWFSPEDRNGYGEDLKRTLGKLRAAYEEDK